MKMLRVLTSYVTHIAILPQHTLKSAKLQTLHYQDWQVQSGTSLPIKVKNCITQDVSGLVGPEDHQETVNNVSTDIINEEKVKAC